MTAAEVSNTGTITVRRLDNDAIARLKDKAKRHRGSIEQVARTVLTRSVGRRLTSEAAREHSRRLREELSGDGPFLDTTDLIRKIRDEDSTTSPDEGEWAWSFPHLTH